MDPKVEPTNDDLANSDFVKQQKCSLYWIVKVLEYAFTLYTKETMKNITLAIGNTGCGKSTLLQALVKSPAAMELKRLESIE